MDIHTIAKGKRILILEGYARQCLPYIREFKKLGCEVSLLCHTRLDCGYASRLPDHKILGVCDPDKYEESKKCIIDLVTSRNYDLVFPLVDFSAQILSENKIYLSDFAKIYANDIGIFQHSQDKLEVMKTCAEIKVPHPETLTDVKSISDILDSKLKFPLIIKPRHGYGSRGFHKLNTEQELKDCIKENNINLSEMIVQEALPESSLVMSDNIFIDKEGEIKSSFLYGCYRVYPLKGGTGTFNITFDRKEIHADCGRLVKKMGLRGAVGVDLMIDSRDNTAKVIEINPRVLACSKIGFMAGVNQAQQVLEDAFDLPVTSFMDYKTDIRLRMSQTDMLWFLKSPNRFRTKPSWFSIKNTKDQTFSWDDPLPWFAFLIRGLSRLRREERARKN